ncbi:hypothetical protein QBC32DRAFT_374108 [Pseudoneurospora amorphoporcata]|uniref:Uncharacterized protein n=1 Tax=Pseudoneurospora amorphoporcata TaxID=241081 RepID=A0AAN6NKV3_9PEZI|nr:hypothetical protein QBC32DRAFT_374108 [Pseudoneurospora amorphoporcata]
MHPLEKRLPEDTDWQHDVQEDKATREEKIRLLQEYQKTHVTEIRKIPWRRSPSLSLFEGIRSRLDRATYQITQVKDMSSSDGTVFRKDFTLTSESGLTYVVAFKEIPTCTCRSRFTTQIPAATIAGHAITAATPTTTRSIGCKGKDNHGVSSSPSEKKDQRDAQANNDPKLSHRTFNPPHSSSSFPSSSSNVQSSCESAIDQQEILTHPSLHKPSPASTSDPPMSNQEPMRLELKEQKEQERVGDPLRGVSQDFSPALAKPLSSVTSVQYPIPTTSAARARIVRQAGETPVPSADAVDSHNSAAIPAAITAKAATPVLPGDIANGVDGALSVSNMDDDIHRRKEARLVQKCRRLEKESARIGKHVKRGMKNVDKEYKLELKLPKEKHEKKCMRIQKRWEKGLKKLTRKRERLEEELGGSCLRTEV